MDEAQHAHVMSRLFEIRRQLALLGREVDRLTTLIENQDGPQWKSSPSSSPAPESSPTNT